jgi:hypothetical protein
MEIENTRQQTKASTKFANPARVRRSMARLLLAAGLLCLGSSLALAQTRTGPVITGPVRVVSVPVAPKATSAPASSQFSISPGTSRFVMKPDANAATTGVQPQRVSLAHLYLHFLLYQNHLDRAAAAREQQGKDGKWLSNHFQQRLGFTADQFALVRATAQRLEPELKDIKAQAVVIVQADRAWVQVHPEASRSRLPVGDAAAVGAAIRSAPVRPGWAKLKQLQQQQETTIQQEVETLKAALGPAPAAKLDNLIQNEWANHVSSIHVQPGQLRSPRGPVRREAQP